MLESEKYLSRLKEIKKQISDWEEQIEELLEKKDGVADRLLRAARTDTERVRGERLTDPVYEAVYKMVDVYGAGIGRATEKINDLYVEMDEMRQRMDSAGLTEKEKKYVHLRFLEGLSITQTAMRMGYCDRQARRIIKGIDLKMAGMIH